MSQPWMSKSIPWNLSTVSASLGRMIVTADPEDLALPTDVLGVRLTLHAV